MADRNRKRASTRAVVEALEKRILYSGDVVGVAAEAAAGVLDDGEAVHHQMMDAEAPSHEAAQAEAKPGVRIVVLDATLTDAQTIADSAEADGALVLRFDSATQSSADVLLRVGQLAEEHDAGIDSLSIVSHGSEGGFRLGNDWVDSDHAGGDASAWQDLAPRLADGANLYLYGCDVAETGGQGQELLDALADATGADVFASDDLTGAGGDWDLEVASTGDEAERLAGLEGALDGSALAGVSDTLADYGESSWSGTETFTDGAISFTLEVTGGGVDIDWEYDGSTDTLSITDSNGSSQAATISITDNNGGLNVDLIQLDGGVGNLISDVDIGEFRPDEDEDFGNIVVGGGSGTIGLVVIPESSNGEIHINGNVTAVQNTDNFETKLYVDGSIASVDLDGFSHQSGRIDVTGNIGNFTAAGEFRMDVVVGGSLTLLDVDSNLTTYSSVNVTGSVGSFHFIQDTFADIDVGGDVGSLWVGRNVERDIDIQGDLDTFTLVNDLDADVHVRGNVDTITVLDDIRHVLTIDGDVGTLDVREQIDEAVTIGGDLDVLIVGDPCLGSVTANGVNGLISVTANGVSYQNDFADDTQVVYDGAASAVTASGPGLMDNLEAHWPMNEGAGQTVFDQSGNANDATLGSSTGSDSSDPAWVFDTEAGGNVLAFDGDDYLDMGSSFPAFGNMTVSAWVKIDTVGIDQAIISAGFNGSSSQWSLKTTTASGNVSFHRYDGAYHGAETTSTLVADQWAHVTGTYDGANWKIYFNGALEATHADAVGISSNTESVYIGAIDSPIGDFQNFEGRIRDVRVYDRVLGDTEIIEIGVGQDNVAPTADALSVNVDEDDSLAILLSGSDANVGDAVEKFRIESLPDGAAGTLTLDGTPLNPGDEVTVAQIAANELVFTPVADYNGAASFTFSAYDGELWSVSTATVSITVDPVNDAPTADAVSLNVDEDDSAAIALTGSDIDGGDAVEKFRIDSLPDGAAGTLTLGGVPLNPGDEVTVAEIAANDLVFTPVTDYNGAASFTFSAHDGDEWSATPATVSITVDPVNDAPTADAVSLNVDEDDSAAIALSGSDIDGGDAVEKFRIDSLPDGATGTLTLGGVPLNPGDEVTVAEIAANALAFTPTADYNGSASFTFSAHDGDAWSATPATVSITVDPVNDAPTADAVSLNVDEDDSAAIALTGSDIDGGDAVEKFRIDSLPDGAAGTLTLGGVPLNPGDEVTVAEIAANALVFTPTADYNGSASFTFSAHDGDAWSATPATVSITVDPVNDAPTADEVAENVDEDISLAITLTGSDIDAGEVVENFRIDSLPDGAAGVLTLDGDPVNVGDEVTAAQIAAGELVFTPASDYHGPASFAFSAQGSEDEWSVATATVSITVDPVNDAPTAVSVDVSAEFGDPMVVRLEGADVDSGDAIERYRVDSLPDDGALLLDGEDLEVGDEVTQGQIEAGALRFQPAVGFAGSGSFLFSTFDGEDWSPESGTAQLEVTGMPGAFLEPDNSEPGNDSKAAGPDENGEPPQGENFASDSTEEEQDEDDDETAIALELAGLEAFEENEPARSARTSVAVDFDEQGLVSAVASGESDEKRTRENDEEREELATQRGPGMAARMLDLDVPVLNELGEDLSRRLAEEVIDEETRVRPVQIAAVATSAGLLALLSRGSSLLAMAVATLPAWRYFDPLAIVSVPQAAKLARDAALMEAKAEDDESGGRLREVLDG